VQKKVRDEILRVLDDDLMPSVEQQKELKYMNIKVGCRNIATGLQP
jgi:hypothetical protein